MQKITRIYVGNYGVDMAWYDGITFDLTDPDTSEPTDTIINLENGGGKTTLLSFIFSCFETSQERFLKHIQNRNHRFSQYFAKDGLPGVALIEWLMPARTAGGEPYRLVMGQVVAVKTTADRDEVDRLFFSFEANGGLSLEAVPAPKLNPSPANNMAEFARWMHEAHKVSPDFFQTRVQSDWQRHLRDERLIDVEMLQLQVNFSAQEGGIDTGFLTFTSEPEFIRKFFDLTLDHERSNAVRLAVVNTCDKLRRKPHFQRCLDELTKLSTNLARFNESADIYAGAKSLQAAAVAQGSGMVLSLDNRGTEQAQLADAQAARVVEQDSIAIEATESMRKLADDIVVLTSLRYARRLHATEAAKDKAKEAHAKAKKRLHHVQAAQARGEIDALENKLSGLNEMATEAQQELEPLLGRVERHGAHLRKSLFAEETKRRNSAKAAASREGNEEQKRVDIRRDLASLVKDEQRQVSELANLNAAEANFLSSRSQLVLDNLLGEDEETKAAVDRWSAASALRKSVESDLRAQAQVLREQETAARENARAQSEEAARLKAGAVERERFVADGESEREKLSQLQILRQAAESETADPDSPALLTALERLALGSEGEVAQSDVRLAALHSGKASIVETGVAGASRDVNQVVARLRELGVKSANPFNIYIAKALPNADEARALVASNPARFMGVSVASAEIVKARTVIGEVPSLSAPVMVSVAALDNETLGDGRFVLTAGDDSAFNVPAAALHLANLDASLSVETARRFVYSERLSDSRSARQRLQAYLSRYGDGAIAFARTEVGRLTAESLAAADRAREAEKLAMELRGQAEDALTKAAECSQSAATAATNQQFVERFIAAHEAGRPVRLSRIGEVEVALEAKAELRLQLERQIETCMDTEKAALGEKLEHENAANLLATERSNLKYYNNGQVPQREQEPQDAAQDLTVLRILYTDAERAYEADAKARLGLLHEQQESTRELITTSRNKFSEEFSGVVLSDFVAFLGADFPTLLTATRKEVDKEDGDWRKAENAYAVVKNQHDVYVKANNTLSQPDAQMVAMDDSSLDIRIEGSISGKDISASQALAAKQEASQCKESARRARDEAKHAVNTAATLRASLSLPDLLNAEPLPLHEDIAAQANAVIQDFNSKAKQVEGAGKKTYKAFEDLRIAASTQSLQQAEPDIASQLMRNDFDAACADSGRILEGIIDRIGATQSSLDGMNADFDACVGELSNLANSAITLLNSATTNKKVPIGAPYVGGKAILKMRARFGELGQDSRKQQLRSYLDSLIDNRAVPARGPELVAEALLRIHGKPLGMQMLKMVPDEALQYVSVDKIQNSGGEGVVMAMFLYMVINQLRSETQAKLKKAGGGPLILDNPFAKATTPTLWKAQRMLAHAMDVQLIFATALPDYNTIGEFGRFVRLRKAGKNAKTGRWHLQAADFKLAPREALPA